MKALKIKIIQELHEINEQVETFGELHYDALESACMLAKTLHYLEKIEVVEARIMANAPEKIFK